MFQGRVIRIKVLITSRFQIWVLDTFPPRREIQGKWLRGRGLSPPVHVLQGGREPHGRRKKRARGPGRREKHLLDQPWL